MADAPDKIERQVKQRTAQLTQTDVDLRLEIEDRTLAEDVLRQLSHRVVQLQDEERRRIARELHDSIGQQLTAIIMGVSTLEDRVRPGLRPEVKEILALVDNCIKDVRTISHLLHPPLLDEIGLLPALEGYVQEFSKRSRIHLEFEMPSELQRMKPEEETAIFRIIQESLTNIHRHSGAQKARILVAHDGNTLRITITDSGRGISKDTLSRMATGQSGVGVTGMRERVKKLGGHFQISSNAQGTTLEVELPLAG